MVTSERELPIYDSTARRLPVVHELGELVRYRYLLWNLISRDLKVRYKRSVLGIAWAMLNPLLTMAVLVVVFSALFNRNVEHYPIYLLSGLLLWNLFRDGTTSAMANILGNRKFLVKMYVPSSVFVVSAVGGALINLLFALGPLLLLALINGVTPRIAWLFLIVPIFLTTILTIGVGLIVAALVIFFLDIRDIYAIVLRAAFYMTPIIYPVSILPPLILRFEKLNPMFHTISGFRSILLEGRIANPGDMMFATLVVSGIIAIGWTVFTRLADRFAYHI